jgi:hypothetical protein
MFGVGLGLDVSVKAVPLLPQILLVEMLAGLEGLHPQPAEPIEIAATETAYIEATWAETVIRGRPWVPHKRIATISRGTRLVVRGIVKSRDDAGCEGKDWYAVYPFGFVCSRHAKPTHEAPPATLALPVDDGQRLPFAYAYVRTDGVNMYTSVDDIIGIAPSRQLTKGMSLVVARSIDVEKRRYVLTTSGELVAKDDVRWGGQGSEWSGVRIDGSHLGPSFAWVTKDKTAVFANPSLLAAKVGKLTRRQRVPLLEDDGRTGKEKMWKIGEGRWVEATRLNEVHFMNPPQGVLADDGRADQQWIDVDIGEQVLIAYRDGQPVFSTLVSSGRSHGTPLGNYPIWAKVASMTMANQDYEDSPYMVQGVPWVLLFQGHNAIHGAYWHDRFGVRKSHGCVNLSPLDARWVFEWVAPSLPKGWTGYLPSDFERSVTVHVRDSSKPEGQRFTQERTVGPPDPDVERKKLEAAMARREEQAQNEALLPTPNPLHDQDLQAGRIEAPALPNILENGS